jgi:trimeric autotransporter adhesin
MACARGTGCDFDYAAMTRTTKGAGTSARAAAALLVLLWGVSCSGQTIITTLAGSRFVFPGGSIAALSAPVGSIGGVTEDAQGNIYFSDLATDRVYRVNSNGMLTVFAGSGTEGYGGDGGPAVSAALYNPRSVVFDAAGNLYISDAGNNLIRKVNTAGIISTVAGNGTSGFSGDGGQAIAASFGGTARITLDSAGNIYISDPDNHRIREVTTDGVMHTFAGNGANASAGDGGPALQASFVSPAGLVFDTSGNLYVTDFGANRVREIAPNAAHTISTVAGTGAENESGDGGLATLAHLNGPAGVALEGTGANAALLVADQDGSRIRSVNLGTGMISTIAGTFQQVGMGGDGGPAVNASLYQPIDLFVASSASGPVVLIADANNFRVRQIANGILTTIAGNGNFAYGGDGGIGTSAHLPGPDGVVIDSSGNVDVCDTYANRVRKIDSFGIINLIAGTNMPGFGGDGGPASAALLVDCQGIALDGAGNMYVADTHDRRIRKISAAGIISTVAGNGINGFLGDLGQAIGAELSNPSGVAVDPQGNLYVADTDNNRIRKITPSGMITTIAGSASVGYAGDGGLATSAQLNAPTRLALDPSGNIYFTDNGNNVVRRVSTAGVIETVAGNGQYGFAGDGGPATAAMLANPIGLTIDAEGGILIADADNLRIRRVGPNGRISTIAGNGTTALAGDGQPPTATGFGSPADVAVDAVGNIYIADQGNRRVRRIQPAPTSIVLSDTGLTFNTAVDGVLGQTRFVHIFNGGAGTISWSAVATVVGPGSWLSVSPAQGTSTSTTTSSALTVAVNIGGLAPGNYYGNVEIASPGVANSPRFITVVLRILTAAQSTGAQVSPASFLFSAAVGGANPAAQTLTLSQEHSPMVSYTSTITYGGAYQFLTATPAAGSLTPTNPASVSLEANIAGLAAGVYTATLNVTFSGGALRAVPVTLTVYEGPSITGSVRLSPRTVCAPTQLLPALTAISQGFSLPAGWPTPIDVTVMDDCGQPFTNGSVTAAFSNGDAPLGLSNLQAGMWSATWAPRVAAETVTITVTAQSSAQAAPLEGTVQVGGVVTPNAEPPIINTGGILNSASFAAGEPSTPGALISIFGANLASGTGTAATTLPLPTQLAGTQVIIGGVLMPLLYAGPTQINAVVPYPLPVNTTQQVIVQNALALSVPEPNMVAPGAPGAFTVNGSGTGAAIVAAYNPDGSGYLVSTTQPAQAGAEIVIYCTGLGGVQTSIDAGDATPLSPLAPAAGTVTLTIGGVTAPAQFAGLVPTLSGLYQINSVIPAGVTGNGVPVVISVAGLAGPPATIAIQ